MEARALSFSKECSSPPHFPAQVPGLVCPSRTSERGGEGHCVKEGRGGEGEREKERAQRG
jgi:hypothetical protein